MHVCWKGTLLNPMKNTFLKLKNCNYMKKMFLMLLVAALTAFSNVEAQTSNNFLEEIKKANLLEGDVTLLDLLAKLLPRQLSILVPE